MKLNVLTFLFFTSLLVLGSSAKSSAQDWRWHKYACMDSAFENGHGYCGYMPRRFYRRMMWCNDTAMCSGRCPYSMRGARWEYFKENEENIQKHYQEMEEKEKQYHEDMMKHEKEYHEDMDKWDYGYRWHRWHRWYQRDYYRGGGY